MDHTGSRVARTDDLSAQLTPREAAQGEQNPGEPHPHRAAPWSAEEAAVLQACFPPRTRLCRAGTDRLSQTVRTS